MIQPLTPRQVERAKKHLEETRDHFIYRCFDADSRLLYIGCTYSIARRMSSHRNSNNTTSRWLQACMATYDVTGPYPTKTAARVAEADAIRTEQPLFNYQERANEYQAAWMTRRAVAAYLLDNGHRELAEQTVCVCWREYRDIGEYDSNCLVHEHLALPEGESKALLEPSEQVDA